MKNIRNFYLKIFIILVGKFSVYLNRHVFIMFVKLNFTNMVHINIYLSDILVGCVYTDL